MSLVLSRSDVHVYDRTITIEARSDENASAPFLTVNVGGNLATCSIDHAGSLCAALAAAVEQLRYLRSVKQTQLDFNVQAAAAANTKPLEGVTVAVQALAAELKAAAVAKVELPKEEV